MKRLLHILIFAATVATICGAGCPPSDDCPDWQTECCVGVACY